MEKTKQKQITDFLINNGVIIVMFILVIVAGLTTQNFFTLNNLNNLLNNMSFRLVIALGIAGCVITHTSSSRLRTVSMRVRLSSATASASRSMM